MKRSSILQRERGWGEVREDRDEYLIMEGAMTRGSEHTTHYRDDGLQNSIPEAYTILLINVILIKFLKNKKVK